MLNCPRYLMDGPGLLLLLGQIAQTQNTLLPMGDSLFLSYHRALAPTGRYRSDPLRLIRDIVLTPHPLTNLLFENVTFERVSFANIEGSLEGVFINCSFSECTIKEEHLMKNDRKLGEIGSKDFIIKRLDPRTLLLVLHDAAQDAPLRSQVKPGYDWVKKYLLNSEGVVSDMDFGRLMLGGIHFTGLVFERTNFAESSMLGTIFQDCTFIDCSFSKGTAARFINCRHELSSLLNISGDA